MLVVLLLLVYIGCCYYCFIIIFYMALISYYEMIDCKELLPIIIDYLLIILIYLLFKFNIFNYFVFIYSILFTIIIVVLLLAYDLSFYLLLALHDNDGLLFWLLSLYRYYDLLVILLRLIVIDDSAWFYCWFWLFIM